MADFGFPITKTQGYDYNFYQKINVNNSAFGGNSSDGVSPDMVIRFHATSIMFLNEATGSGKVVEYSFNGNTVHGELDPTLPSAGLTFDNRTICFIWFRLKSGSAGPVTVRVDAW